MKVVGRVRLTRQRHVRFGQDERSNDVRPRSLSTPARQAPSFHCSRAAPASIFSFSFRANQNGVHLQDSCHASRFTRGMGPSQAPMLLLEPTSTTAASMTHPGQPSTSSGTSEALDTALDLTVEGLDAAKDIIVDALSVPGIGVALDAAIGILKKIQVCGPAILLCSSFEWTVYDRLRSRTAMH